MKNLLFYALSVGLIISVWSGLSNFSYSQQSASIDSSVNSSGNSDVQSFTSIQTNQRSQSSSNIQTSIQESTFSLSSANLNQPQTLKINSSGTKLKGEISINGKVVQQLDKNQSEINLSPYLSTGTQKVEIKANYTPTNADVSVEIEGSGSNISQQTSGSGTLNYTLNLTVQ
ncbi:hypothetical protein [Brunnivagina elsteri]|uniref:Uncharacterized protein n=1 Tax=Brunnivagina elsteri CCALA 953 TaxID=987040 RepID=A0A2A2TM51_9CYAN|nr:hypothetical protein [Calothrix elsteri]PAX59636.1 hypothetical protein CK510_06130 [Calothrix elsteri CCALA 953]